MNADPTLIPQASEVLIAIKLKNGSDILGTLIDEDLHKIYVEHPIEIKCIEVMDPDTHEIEYHFVPRIWTQYSTRITVDIKKEDYFWFGPMSSKYMKFYSNTVNTSVSTEVANTFLNNLIKKQ